MTTTKPKDLAAAAETTAAVAVKTYRVVAEGLNYPDPSGEVHPAKYPKGHPRAGQPHPMAGRRVERRLEKGETLRGDELTEKQIGDLLQMGAIADLTPPSPAAAEPASGGGN